MSDKTTHLRKKDKKTEPVATLPAPDQNGAGPTSAATIQDDAKATQMPKRILKFDQPEISLKGTVVLPLMLSEKDIFIWRRNTDRPPEETAELEKMQTAVAIAYHDRLHFIREWNMPAWLLKESPPFAVMRAIVEEQNKILKDATAPPL